MMQSGRGKRRQWAREPRGRRILLAATILLAGVALANSQAPATAQTAPAKPAAHVTHRTAAHTRKKAVTVPAPIEPIAVQPLPPPEPEKPKWPAFDPAAAASVVWDSRGLSINATNSSLQQIMKDVATDTGAKIEGLSADQRVFGVYGPGQARDVLSQLLQGSGYNVIMIGDLGAGAPRQILLSMRSATGGAAQPNVRANAASNNEEDAEPEEQPELERPAQPQPGQQFNPRPFNPEHPPLPGQPFGNQAQPQNPQN